MSIPALGPTRALARPPRRASWLVALFITMAPVYAGAAETVHVVEKGQTLGAIAKRYHVTVDALREANDLRRFQQIHPGLELAIPDKGREAGATRRAVVKKGDPSGKVEKVADRGRKGGLKAKKGDPEGKPEPAWGKRRAGFVRMSRGTEKLEAQFLTRHGRLAPSALSGLSHLLRFYPTGTKIPIDPRLASLVGAVSDHFGGRPIRVVSGFRPYSPAQYTPHSNHNFGRAMDFSVEGIPNTVVRDFCRTFRNAGVGYYPNSTFVHLDVRAGKAYWIDYSRPGEAPHYDSPNARSNADEAAQDVEPHAGAIDAAEPDPARGPGSNETP